jgi:RNA-directed DNA polymerase
MSSLTLQAAHELTWDGPSGIDWAACRRRVRSLQRRIVKSLRAGHWRKVKRLCFLRVNSFAARALGVKRVTENSGKKTADIDGKVLEDTGPEDASRRGESALEGIPSLPLETD